MLYVAADSGDVGKDFEEGSHRVDKDETFSEEAFSPAIRTALLGLTGTGER